MFLHLSYVPTSYLLNPKPKGSIYFGILSTFLSLIILDSIPFLGWLLAGIFGGLSAKGKGRGFLAAFLGGLIVAISLIEISHYVPVTSLSFIPHITGNFSLYTKITDTMQYTSNALNTNEIKTISSILIDGAVVTGIGGFIGGSILPNENTFEN